MAHFSHINNEGIVDQVIVIDEATLATGHWGDPSEWVQTSYNTSAGEYKRADKFAGTIKDSKARDRKNYAGIGYSYDKVRDAFIPPQPFKSWILNEETCQWEAPKPMPKLGMNEVEKWDEKLLDWVILK